MLIAVSPKRKDGSRGALYVTSGASDGLKAFEVALSGSSKTTPVHLFSSKHGSISNAVWSKDGETLAFANDRFDHAFIGLYHRGQDRLQWLSPSVDTDTQVVA
jgi:hypothetical protein